MPSSTPRLPDPLAERIGTGADRIGPYRLIRPISAGGMARVYEGRFESLAGVSTRVAIKIIHPDYADEAAFRELFIQEARISARLEHLNLVRVQQFNREDDLYYLVMEYIDGVTFRKIVSSCRKYGITLPPALLAEMARQVCDGLAYAHTLMGESGQPLRLVHRDIKPSNLMLNTQGVSKLLDFGISYAHGADEARGSVKGTWGYMAPEQSTGEPVGPAADLFGLAAVLYEVASREPLFPETDTAVVGRLLVADEAARRAAGLGGAYLDLAGVLVRALQRDPDARFPSAEAMGRALGALVPDPLSARDGLVRLVTELRRYDAGPSPMADGRNEGAADGAQGGQRRSSSSQASNASAASVASQSTLNPGSGGTGRGRSGRVSSLADGEAAGLPVAVGGAHSARRSTVGRRPRSASPSMNTVLSLGFAVLAVAVLAFTAWRLYLGPRTQPAPRPDAAEEFPGEPSGEGWAASVHDAVAPESEAASGMQPSPASSDVPPTTSSTSSGSVATRAPANAPAQAGANPPGALSSSRRPPTRAVADGPAPTPASLVADLAPSSEEGAARGSPSSPGSASGTPIAVPPGATPASASNLPGTSSASSPSRGAASDARAGEGSLSLGSTPRAQVMIDGAYVRYTPIFQHNLPAGSHTVIFVTDDGRRKSFRVDIGEGVEARKVWLFDENRWADGASAEP